MVSLVRTVQGKVAIEVQLKIEVDGAVVECRKVSNVPTLYADVRAPRPWTSCIHKWRKVRPDLRPCQQNNSSILFVLSARVCVSYC
jgi:hypothetical protein